MAKLYKFYQLFNSILRYAIIISAFLYIGYRLVFGEGAREALSLAANLFAGWEGLLLIGMMLVNWGIEAYKWKYVVSKTEDLPFLRSLLGVFAGVTTSIFMPFRTGEFVGRIFILKNTKPLKALLMSMVGSVAQLVVTILFGTLAFLILFFWNKPFPDIMAEWVYVLIMVVLSVLLATILFVFLNLKDVSRLVYRYCLSKRWIKVGSYVRVLMNYSGMELFIILLMSMVRYLVFTSQYVLLLMFFGINLGFGMLFLLVSLIYILMTLIPSVAFAEIAIRGSMAVIMMVPILKMSGLYFSGAEDNIIAAATVLWVINLAVPALIGMFGVWRLRFLKRS